MEQLKLYLKLYYTEIRTRKPIFCYWLCLLLMTGIYLALCMGWQVVVSVIYVFYYILVLMLREVTTPKFQKIHYIVPLELKTLQGYMCFRMLMHELYLLVLMVVSCPISLVVGMEWSVWRAVACFFVFSFFIVCSAREGSSQLLGSRKISWEKREIIEFILEVIALCSVFIIMFGEVEGIVGSILLLLGFLGWLVLHAMVRRRFKKNVLWQDYKEPKPFWSAPGSE